MADRSEFSGAWHALIDAADGNQEQALLTLTADGCTLCSPAPALPQPAAPGGVVFLSAGHGSWGSTGADEAVITYKVLASDARGQPFGVATVRGKLTLDADGQAFSGEGVRTIVNAHGMTLAATPATVRATRIVAEAPAMPTAGTRAAMGGA
jgi:hypothetical protein